MQLPRSALAPDSDPVIGRAWEVLVQVRLRALRSTTGTVLVKLQVAEK